MLVCVRTTIRLPDSLYDDVRLAALQQHRTVTSFIEEALRAALRERASSTGRVDFQIDPIPGRGLQPGVDLDDSSALLDLMDDDARP